MSDLSRNLLLSSVLLLGSLVISACGSSNYYEEKLVNDARDSFDISKSKAECLTTVVLNRTGWESKKAWNVLKENFERSSFNAEGMKFANAMDSGFITCGINPD